MRQHLALQPIDHAAWCDRRHPETEDGLSYLVSEEYHLAGQHPYTDANLNAALLAAFGKAAADLGTPLVRLSCEGHAVVRLCAITRLHELEQQVAALIESFGASTAVE